VSGGGGGDDGGGGSAGGGGGGDGEGGEGEGGGGSGGNEGGSGGGGGNEGGVGGGGEGDGGGGKDITAGGGEGDGGGGEASWPMVTSVSVHAELHHTRHVARPCGGEDESVVSMYAKKEQPPSPSRSLAAVVLGGLLSKIHWAAQPLASQSGSQ